MNTYLVNGETLIESLEVAIMLLDNDCVIKQVNIATETLFEQSRRNLIERQLEELIPQESVHKCFAECLANGSQFTLREVALNVAQKEVLMDMTISSVAGSGDKANFVLLEINSINRISRFMREKNQLERQQSFRLMMRGLAHEIKNPLGGIRGAAQLLGREITSSSHQKLTDILIKEADRLTRLVDRVMGSREQLKLERLNIHEVLEHVLQLVNVKTNNKLKIERFYDPTLPEINVDKEQLIQAVLNIVGNALEAQEGSDRPKIGITTEFIRLLTINQKIYRQALKICIWDEGVGVNKEIREIIFDPLITTKHQGTGLGLSITQEIIQRHQGVVQLEDFKGNTCFSISLPYIKKLESETKQETINELL